MLAVTALVALAVLVVAGIAVAGGGGSESPGVASVDSANSSGESTSGQQSTQANAAEYSKCMREHGVENFPDPDSDGRTRITSGAAGSQGLDPNNPQFQTAQKACESLRPSEGTPEQQAARRSDALKYAKCMRSHGISDFPDPNPAGGFQLQPSAGSNLNPNDPQFQTAQKACDDLRPGGGETRTGGIG
jgi:hypothetical protein